MDADPRIERSEDPSLSLVPLWRSGRPRDARHAWPARSASDRHRRKDAPGSLTVATWCSAGSVVLRSAARIAACRFALARDRTADLVYATVAAWLPRRQYRCVGRLRTSPEPGFRHARR